MVQKLESEPDWRHLLVYQSQSRTQQEYYCCLQIAQDFPASHLKRVHGEGAGRPWDSKDRIPADQEGVEEVACEPMRTRIHMVAEGAGHK